jgi:hypothetical protein
MVVRAVGALVDLRLATGQMGMPVGAVATVLRGAVALAAASAIVAWLVRSALVAAGVGLFPRLAAATVAAGGLYLVGLGRLRPPGYDDLARGGRALARSVATRRRRTPATADDEPALAGRGSGPG